MYRHLGAESDLQGRTSGEVDALICPSEKHHDKSEKPEPDDEKVSITPIVLGPGTYRIGAVEQVRIYSRILGIPMIVASLLSSATMRLRG